MNNRGTLELTCTNGAFVDSTVCIDADVCTDNVTQPGMTACGFNDRGFLDERCTTGQWSNTTTCVDPDECTDNATQAGTTACGLNGRGRFGQVCTLGNWTDTATCADTDVCTDSTSQPGPAACGLNTRGRLNQQCTTGQWVNTATCVDPDVCTDNATQDTTVVCGFNNRGTWDQSCVAGQWANTRCDECGSVVREGSVYIDDPSDIAGLAGVTRLNGYLVIYDNPSITSLVGLESLACIRDGLDLQNNNRLTSLSGLTVAEVGSILIGNAGPQFTTLAGLEHLTRVTNGALTIYTSDGLTDVDELSSLVSVHGNLMLRNENLASLLGLSSLTRVGSLTIGPPTGCPSVDLNNLTSLQGLEGLTVVGRPASLGTIDIACNPLLVDISALALAFANPVYVSIRQNSTLTNLAGMETYVGGANLSVTLGGNALLSDLSALGSVTELASLYVQDNDALTNLQGLSALSRVGTLEVAGNAVMASLLGLSSLTTIHSALYVNTNPQLSSLEGLDRVTGGTLPNAPYVDLRALPSLQSVSGLRSLQNARRLTVDRCDQLQNLNGLQALTSLEDELVVIQNARLTSLAGLDNLARMGNNPPYWLNAGSVWVYGNPLLTSLTGLGGLTSTLCRLDVQDHPLLADISGLGNVSGLATSGCNIYGPGRANIINNDGLTTLTGLGWLSRAQDLRIVGNSQLVSVAALANLRQVHGTLEIGSNTSFGASVSTDTQPLTSLAGLGGVTTVGIFALHGMPNVTSLPAMPNWTGNTQTSLYIDNMPGLTSLDGLEALTTLHGLYLGGGSTSLTHTPANDLPALQDIDALRNLVTIASTVQLHRVNISLAPLASARHPGGVTGISWSISNSTISGLNGIGAAGVVYSLTLNRVATPTGSLSGLESLTRINGTFALERTFLSSLTGLSGLTTVTGTVRLDDNDALTTLAGFNNLTSLQYLIITNHLLLKQCEANAFHQDLITNHGYTAGASISGNTGAGVCP